MRVKHNVHREEGAELVPERDPAKVRSYIGIVEHGVPMKALRLRMAWEFLRRNKTYQDISKNGDWSWEDEQGAATWGLSNFQLWSDPWDKVGLSDINKWHFGPTAIVDSRRWEIADAIGRRNAQSSPGKTDRKPKPGAPSKEPEWDRKNIELGPGVVIAAFRENDLVLGPRYIAKQLDWLKIYLQRRAKLVHAVRVSSRPQINAWLKLIWLADHDLVYPAATNKEVCELWNMHEDWSAVGVAGAKGKSGAKEAADLQEADVSTKKKSAYSMIYERGYLRCV